jgi:hypothetical protein
MTKLIFVIALVGLIIVVVPLATIWSLNTLFPVLAIPYSIDTWLAAVVLGSVVGGTTGVSFKK